MTKDEFDAWWESPAAEQMRAALQSMSGRARERWMLASWEQGNIDPVLLADLRARAQVIDDLCALTFETIEEELHGEHERD